MPISQPILPELRDHAEAIGYVCIHWAHMELEIDGWLSCLTPLEPAPVNDIVISEIDFRAKLTIIKNLAHVRAHNRKWFKSVKVLLDHINNDLRPERNRMVHDLWLVKGYEDQPGRMTRGAKLSKEPPAGDFKLTTNPMAPMPVSDIIDLLAQIVAAQAILFNLRGQWLEAKRAPSQEIPPRP